MRIVMSYHSLISDWNNGNAHFLRGVAHELLSRGHQVDVYEPADAWSVRHLLAEHGEEALARFHAVYPRLRSHRYQPGVFDVDDAVARADLVLVHEWNDAALVARIGAACAARPFTRLLFHDTHHRSVSDQRTLAGFDLTHYDGVLAYGRVIRDRYLSEGWARRAWTWHEAADSTVFRPRRDQPLEGDLVWIGNWGDDERAEALEEFLIEPVARLGLTATVYGVRYPPDALQALTRAGIRYGGWLPNFEVPRIFGRYRVTVHVPRRPYAAALPGIPTIRPFEALACAIPLVSAPWHDVEGLFDVGQDFRMAADGDEMTEQLAAVLSHPGQAALMAARGLQTIRTRHTCAHRVDALLSIHAELLGQRGTVEA
jgi:spore maturation protein CgeB